MLEVQMESNEFLGEEFLTWLAWRVASQAPEYVHELCEPILLSDDGRKFAPEGVEVVRVGFERTMTMKAGKDRTTIAEADPAQSVETRFALRQGKLVAAARVALVYIHEREGERSTREFKCTIKGATLGLSGVELPTALDNGPRQERDDVAVQIVEERIMLMGELDALVLGLYRTFLELRRSWAWNAGEEGDPGIVERMRAWVMGRGSDDGIDLDGEGDAVEPGRRSKLRRLVKNIMTNPGGSVTVTLGRG